MTYLLTGYAKSVLYMRLLRSLLAWSLSCSSLKIETKPCPLRNYAFSTGGPPKTCRLSALACCRKQKGLPLARPTSVCSAADAHRASRRCCVADCMATWVASPRRPVGLRCYRTAVVSCGPDWPRVAASLCCLNSNRSARVGPHYLRGMGIYPFLAPTRSFHRPLVS